MSEASLPTDVDDVRRSTLSVTGAGEVLEDGNESPDVDDRASFPWLPDETRPLHKPWCGRCTCRGADRWACSGHACTCPAGTLAKGGYMVSVNEAGEATVMPVWQTKGVPDPLSPPAPKRIDWDVIADFTAENIGENVERAGRRARGEVRRFCVHNGLTRLWVLTFEQPHFDHGEAMKVVATFVRRFKRKYGDQPYVYGLEPHPGVCSSCGQKVKACKGCSDGEILSHGWHANLVIRADFIDKAELQTLWGQGNVRFEDRKVRGAVKLSARERTRRLGSYVAKYFTKAAEELALYGCEMRKGAHRYEVSQGHKPRWTRSRVASELHGFTHIVREHGRITAALQFELPCGGGTWLAFEPAPP